MHKPEKIERHQPGLGIAPIFATVGNINEFGVTLSGQTYATSYFYTTT